MHRDNRCMYMGHVCFMSVVVTVMESMGMFVVQRPFLKIMFFWPWSVEVSCMFV